MPYIVLDEEQARILREANEAVEVRDQSGQCLGAVTTHGFTPEQIEEAKRRARSEGPWYTTQEVLDHLQSLEG